MIVTIDGPSGSGKSTIAKKVAEKINFEYFDTGAMYRAFTYFIIKNKIDPKNDAAIENILFKFNFEIDTKGINKHYLVNKKDVSLEIRSPKVTALVSEISAKPFVRKLFLKIQRNYAKNKRAVFDGRDMGSVVFPIADVKIFLTASIKERARRRFQELLKKFPEKKEEIKLDEILIDIEKRDRFDSTRKISPLICPQDAHVIDTSNLSIEEVVDKVLSFIKPGLKTKMRFLYKFVRGLCKKLFHLFYKFEVYGTEHLIKGGAIIASSHSSFLDPIAIAISCPEEVHFLAKTTLFSKKIFKKIIEKLNAHPIAGPRDKNTFKIVENLIKDGKKIVLFPEGTRSKKGEIIKVKPGAAFLMSMTECPIIPAYIYGAQKVWGRHQKLPKLKGKIKIIFGQPISYDEFISLEKKNRTSKICSKIETELKKLRDCIHA